MTTFDAAKINETNVPRYLGLNLELGDVLAWPEDADDSCTMPSGLDASELADCERYLKTRGMKIVMVAEGFVVSDITHEHGQDPYIR